MVKLKSINTSSAGPKLFGLDQNVLDQQKNRLKSKNNYLCEVEMQEISAGFGDFRQIEDP